MDKDIYQLILYNFPKKLAGLGEYKYTAYIALNDELQDIPELNIKYI
ncbi:hypothetical protein UM760_10125 [Staphylococcus aureus]|nr:hypothetical protein UM760_10125 [Staphylococcus aureus]